ncbi:hypothetical protein MJO29_010111 [Puccinia striiformis f. sp. tritici]|nr:hypothetical protein MJO29_010111 [Puccinia striiformis f. sp. tritici]
MVIHYNRPQKRGTLAQRLWRDRHAAEIQAQQNRFFAPRGRRDRLHDQRLQAIADQRDSEYAIIQDDIEPGPRWTPQRDDSDDDYDRAVYAERAQWRQRAKDFNWKSVMPALHSWFMALKLKTKNWTIATSNEDHGNCKCAPHKLTRRWVDLVDVNWQGRRRIPFCECSSDATRLLHYGYIAASPISPQTAFSLSLLIFHNSMWNNCHVKAQPFMLAMTEWLEPRSEQLHVRGKKHARDLRKPFSAAVDLYRMLENMADDTISEALCLNAQEIQALEGCPACFGPRPPNLADYSAKTRDKLIICFDGNFQHRHHTKAGRQYRPIENPRIFVPPADFTQMQEAIRAREVADTAPEKADRCADSHKAADDKRNESTWKGCDDTGLMGACCRHDAAIMMGNIYKSGEQRCFPVTMLNKLLTQCEGDRQVGILYDIGCSLDKYMDARGILEEYRPRLSFGTSVFHAYVHNWICQLDYHPRLNDGWGLSDGEGLERLWSYLLPLVSALRYATRNHRLAAIAHRLKYHNWKGKRDLPKWLKNKFTSALKRRHEASGVLVGLSVMRNPHVATGANYTKSFFKDQWKAQRVFQKQHTEAEANRRDPVIMSSDSDSSDDKSSNRFEKLTTSNWVSWKSRFMLDLKSQGLQCLFDDEWVDKDENKEKLARRNCKALKLLYQTVHKDLHNDILANDTSFVDAYDALASTCGQDSVIVVCSSFRKLHQMKYQPGSSLSEHIAKFKSAYTRLIDQTMNHMPEFGTVTSFQATAFFLDSLDNDTNLTPIIQTCYDLRPFDLKTVTDRVNFEAMHRTNRVEQQNSVMMATSSNPSSKPNKKKNKQSDAPRPKAVAPTINNSVSKSVSGNPSSSNKNQSMSDPIDNRFKSLEKSVSELTDLVKKLVSNNMVGMVHGQESGSQSTSGPFDVESDRSNFFVGTVQHSSREYYSRFLVFDTGATQSCVINLELLTDVQPLTNHFMNTFSSPIEATHVGTLKIGDYFINPVYHVPNGCANILSASQLIDHGLKPHFKTDQFLLKGGDKIVATFPRIGRLFLAPISDYICVVNMKIPENFDWHYALGHASDKYVDIFCRHNNASSAMSTKSANCEICTKAKIHRTPHSRKLPLSTTPFHRLHTDVLQITPISKFGYRYVLVIIDDASRFNRIYLLKSKSESEVKLLSFFEEIKNKLQRMPAYLHSDRGGEFSSLKFLAKIKEYGISIERGPANSPQTNGVAERFNGVILEKIKCMLLQSKIPQSMWHEAACHASTILNILPHSSLNWMSPTSVLVKHNSLIEPDRTGMPLIPFGARVVVHCPESLKVSPTGVELLFLGFEPNSDAARFYDFLVHRIVISRDYVVPNIEVDAGSVVVKKDVKSLPNVVQHATKKSSTSYARLPGGYSSSSSSDSSDDKSSVSDESVAHRSPDPLQDDNHQTSDSDVSFETEAAEVFRRGQKKKELARRQNQSGETERPNNVNDSSNGPPNQGRHYSLSNTALNRLKPSWEYVSDHHPAKEIRGNVDASNILQTRRRQQLPQASSSIDQQPDIVNLVQPVSMADALASPLEKPLWLEAMSNEHASQLAHITGDLVPPPNNEKIIGGMWVLVRKLNEANEVIRHKARWVGFGNHQEPNKHYHMTYASVGRIETFKVLLSIAVTYKWQVFQFDVETAFLHGEMDADVYVRQVSGFEVPGKENWVWKLNKSLYGMKQAPRMWKKHLTETLKTLGLVPSIMDDALFYNSDRTLFLHMYVDDGLIVGQNKSIITSFLDRLKNSYKLKVKEKPTQHLGYSLEWKTNSVILHHQAYAEKILKAFNMENSNAVKTPLPSNALHQVDLESEPFDASIMQKAMGYINYLAIHTRPDIVFATNLLSRYSSKPTKHHWSLVKHLLRYIKGTIKFGLEIKDRGMPRDLVGFADADYAMSSRDKKSTTGYVVQFCCACDQ